MQVTLYCKKCKKFNVYDVKDDMTKEDIDHIKCKFCDNKEQSLIDQDIATVITLLNAKGYETVSSCAGHVEKLSKSGKLYYSLPYISFKSLFTTPSTVPAKWTFENIPLKLKYSTYNLFKNMNICALQDINSRSIVPAYSSDSYITELQWKKCIEELKKWAKDLPECYTDNKEDKILYYKLKSINKNIDALIIQSKIYNELAEYINQIYDVVKEKEYDVVVSDAYTVNIAADINDSRTTVQSIITINAYLKVESSVEIQLEIKNLVNLSSEDVLSLKFVTRDCEEYPDDYIVYDTSILTNAYLATEFIIYNRIKDYNKFEYILEDKEEYVAPIKVATINISKIQNNATIPIAAIPKSSVQTISIPTADSTNLLLADAIMKLIDTKLDKKIEDKISSMRNNNSSKN